jgi:uncharacterized protein (DUF433 family)
VHVPADGGVRELSGPASVLYTLGMAAQRLADRVVIDPDVLTGKPVVEGTRISVELVMELLGSGWPEADVLKAYPHLIHEDVLACLNYAARRLASERISPIAG